jgi:predicted nucleotidyltransferase
MRTLNAEEMARFRQTMHQREAQCQQQLAQRFQAAQQVVQKAAQLLKQDFAATQVILFGSVMAPERFHFSSDIDLAVAGLAPLDYFTAVAQLQDLSTFKIDLVRLESCKPGLKAVILTEGQHL